MRKGLQVPGPAVPRVRRASIRATASFSRDRRQDVVLDAGIDVPMSCREGLCGRCETPILAGEADHRDALLTEEERAANRSLMICCSGARSTRLVLDL